MADDELAYADAMDELETILAELEREDVDIDHLAERVARARRLIELCRRPHRVRPPRRHPPRRRPRPLTGPSNLAVIRAPIGLIYPKLERGGRPRDMKLYESNMRVYERETLLSALALVQHGVITGGSRPGARHDEGRPAISLNPPGHSLRRTSIDSEITRGPGRRNFRPRSSMSDRTPS